MHKILMVMKDVIFFPFCAVSHDPEIESCFASHFILLAHLCLRLSFHREPPPAPSIAYEVASAIDRLSSISMQSAVYLLAGWHSRQRVLCIEIILII